MKKKKGIIIGLIIIIVIAILLLLRGCSKEVYTITFKDYNGTILKVVEVKENEVPVFDEIIERDNDGTYAYSFLSWDKELIPTTKDETYTAVYSSSLLDSNDDATRDPNSSTETINFTDEEKDKEDKEKKKELDITEMSFWIVTYDQNDNVINRYTAKYGTVVNGPNGESVIVNGNVRFDTFVEEEQIDEVEQDTPVTKGTTLTIDGKNYRVLSIDEDNVAKVLSMEDVGVGVKFRDKEMIKIGKTTLDESDTIDFQITTENKRFSKTPGGDVILIYYDFDLSAISYGGSVIENYLDNDYYSSLSDNIKNAIVEKNYCQKIIETLCNGEEYTYYDYNTAYERPEDPRYITILAQHDFGPKKVRPMGIEDILEYMPKTFYQEDVFELLYNRRTTEEAENQLYLANGIPPSFPPSYVVYCLTRSLRFSTTFPVPLNPAPPFENAYRVVMYLDLDKLEYSK